MESQNSAINLERLSAYDNYCRKGERLSVCRFVMCVLLVVIMSVARIWLWISVFYCNLFLFTCFFAALVWKMVDSEVRQTGLKSAKFLQLMQCELLGTRWNQYLCGEKPLPEEVFVNIRRPIDQYQNWYSNKIGDLPENKTILCCFYLDSIRYARLRMRHINWCNWIFGISIILVVASSILVVASNWNALVLYIIAPCVPLIVWYSAVRAQHRKSSEQILIIQQMIHDAVAADFSSDNNDLIQDNLFLYYKDVYQIPRLLEWPYLRKIEALEREYVIEAMKNK